MLHHACHGPFQVVPLALLLFFLMLPRAPVLSWSLGEQLRNHAVIWFIDNKSAESALVKAGSPTTTMCRLALIAIASFARIGARVWFEYVPSKDNPSDVLSRAGFYDPMVRAKVSSGEWSQEVAVEPPILALDFEALWRITADDA